MSFQNEDNLFYLQRKIGALIFVVLMMLFIILSRLYFLQVHLGEKYARQASEIVLREEELVARRGSVLTVDDKLIADTRPYYEITLTPQYISKLDDVIASLSKFVPIDEADVRKRYEKARYQAKFQPVVIAEDIPYNWVAKLEEALLPYYSKEAPYDLSGVNVKKQPLRRYRYPEYFSHVLGYLKEIDKKGLAKARQEHPGVYSLGDLVGAAGVEKAYDLELKGLDGVYARVVDARGREIANNDDLKNLQITASFDPKPGYDLRTSLHFGAQQAAHDAFGDYKGAVVALNPNNGQVIALYSTPGYDANRITKKIDKKYWQKINLDSDKYLFNRAIQAMYPPASTYKMVGLSAAIDLDLLDPEKDKVRCSGGLRYGNRFFKCWKRGGHGLVDAVHALAWSCDVFFYKYGAEIGVDRLAEYSKMFGFSKPSGIELPYEKGGLIPTQEWKEKRYKQPWYPSETLSVSIGQSYNLTTTLQNAVAVSLVANDGYRVTPHIGYEFINSKGEVIETISRPRVKSKLAESKALEWVRKGMIEVVHGAGTARRLRQSPNKIAGKTGTAQVIGHGKRAKKGVNTENHALFVSFAPYDNPQIAVAVMVEHGRGGSSTAAPIAMKVIDAYFEKGEPK